MTQQELKDRTKQFAVRIIKLSKTLKGDFVELTIAKQILRSGTSVGANYRSACFAKSTNDFINKLKIVEEELDETIYWMELLVEAKVISESKLKSLKEEAEQLFKIIPRSIKTSKQRYK
jgi:four helix bundle protein